MKTLAILSIALLLFAVAIPSFASHPTSISTIVISGKLTTVNGVTGILITVDNTSSQPIYKIRLDASTGFLKFDKTGGWVADKDWQGKDILIKTLTKPIQHDSKKKFFIKVSDIETTKIIIKWSAWTKTSKIQNSVFLVK